MQEILKTAAKAGEKIKQQAAGRIDRAIVLGSGLSAIAKGRETGSLPYIGTPGMVPPSVTGHGGEFRFSTSPNGVTAFCLGRLHLYEGHSARQVAFMMYALSAAGAKEVIVTNAAGALNPNYVPGDVMLISDHINHTGHNPLVGWHDDSESRFVDMSEPYDRSRREQLSIAAKNAGLTLHEGIYAGVLGPSLETCAERRMLRQWGADAVGMSTIMEVIAARHCGMRVLGLCAITNMATGDEAQQPDNIERIFENAAIAASKIKILLGPLLD